MLFLIECAQTDAHALRRVPRVCAVRAHRLTVKKTGGKAVFFENRRAFLPERLVPCLLLPHMRARVRAGGERRVDRLDYGTAQQRIDLAQSREPRLERLRAGVQLPLMERGALFERFRRAA